MPVLPTRSRGFILITLLILLVLALGGTIALGFWLLRLDGVVQEKFEGKRWAIPARVYARLMARRCPARDDRGAGCNS